MRICMLLRWYDLFIIFSISYTHDIEFLVRIQHLLSIYLESLITRPDHNLEDLRAKIFPSKRRKFKTPEVVPVILPPVRRKERSLSSLVVNSPRVSSHATATGRRTAAAAARIGSILRTPRVSSEKRVKKEDDSMDDGSESSSSLETSDKFNQNKRPVKKTNLFPFSFPCFSCVPTQYYFFPNRSNFFFISNILA